MHHLPENMKILRKSKGWTQTDLAHNLGVKRSLIGAYEEGRAEPRIAFLQMMSEKFRVPLDQLINVRLDGNHRIVTDVKGSALRVLPIMVDDDNEELATLVPVKAAAGYLSGYGDVEFIETLPTFRLPFPELPRGKTYRLFQVKGDSMLPVESGSYVICTYVQDWNNIRNDQCYVIVSKSEGIVFKRVLNNQAEGTLTLKSDNSAYHPFTLVINDVLEVWKAEGITRIGLPDPIRHSPDLSSSIEDLRKRLASIERKISK